MEALSLALPFQNALCHGSHDTIVPSLDVLKRLCKALVVVIDLRWPVFVIVIRRDVISSKRRSSAVSIQH